MKGSIRPATTADVPAIASFWRVMCDELGIAPKGFVPDWRERLERHFAAGIADGSQGWFVADAGQGPAGCGAAFLVRSETARVQHEASAHVAGVYVAPASRRKGVARALVEACVAWARERGCTAVTLQASELGEPLYRELGFRPGRQFVLRLDR